MWIECDHLFILLKSGPWLLGEGYSPSLWHCFHREIQTQWMLFQGSIFVLEMKLILNMRVDCILLRPVNYMHGTIYSFLTKNTCKVVKALKELSVTWKINISDSPTKMLLDSHRHQVAVHLLWWHLRFHRCVGAGEAGKGWVRKEPGLKGAGLKSSSATQQLPVCPEQGISRVTARSGWIGGVWAGLRAGSRGASADLPCVWPSHLLSPVPGNQNS